MPKSDSFARSTKLFQFTLFALLVLPVFLKAHPDQSKGDSSGERIGWIEPVEQKIEGWTVYVDPKLLGGEHGEEGRLALQMLANHLQRIKIFLPKETLKEVQGLDIWIEHEHPKLVPMQYHPSAEWLTSHGYDPRLSKKVHITRARELLSPKQMRKQPAVILHELAHAYHDQILSFDRPDIIEAYDSAMKTGKYEKVMLYDGRHVKHYGATDHKEYFAEATEAYFYRNDFYPFVAAELKLFDPKIYAIVEDVWGIKK